MSKHKSHQKRRRTTNSASPKRNRLLLHLRSNLWSDLINGIDRAEGPYMMALGAVGDRVTAPERLAIYEEVKQTLDKARRALLKAAEEDDRRLLGS